jgi:hypothetical protein
MNKRVRQFIEDYHYPIFAWVVIAVCIVIGIRFGVDERLLGAIIVLVGVLGQAFAALIAWVGFVPLVGPIIAKVLALPAIWLLNGIGYLVSLVAIKRGYSKDVISYRVVTIALLVGITIGYILGKLI